MIQSNLVLLPQDPLILLFLADFLVVSKLVSHLLRHGRLPLQGNLVLQHVLGVLVSEGQQPGADQGANGEDDSIGGDVDGVDAPVKPYWNGRDYEGIAIEQCAGLGRDVLVETLQ